jgi:broad specificity phosphatase PhoE
VNAPWVWVSYAADHRGVPTGSGGDGARALRLPWRRAGRHTLDMASTIVFLVRHAKAANRDGWTGGDRDRPLIDKGRKQADRLAAALRREQPVLVAASPWLRCRQTAAPLAAAMGLQVELDDRLGYDAADVAGWVRSAAADHPGQAVAGISHGDLIPMYLLQAGLVDGFPAFRTGSLYRLEVSRGRVAGVTLVDRKDLKRQLGDS